MQTSALMKENERNFLWRMLDNPIVVKELKGRMRGRQGATLVTVYLILIGLFVTGVYLYLVADGELYTANPNNLQDTGRAVFSSVVLSELLMLAFIGPALTSGAIASERERQTFDLLRISLLSPRNLALGKLASAVAYLLLLIFTAVPIQSVAFFLGGVGMTEMIVSIIMLVVSAFFFCALGLYFSSIAKRPLTATITSYGMMALPVILLILLFFLIGNSGNFLGNMSLEAQFIFLRFLWTLYSTNPFIGAIGGELVFMESQSLFIFYFDTYTNTPPLALLSPWLIYVLYASALTFFMIRLSIFYLKRYEY